MSDTIKTLLDYTIEHQKMTLTLATAVVGALGFGETQNVNFQPLTRYAFAAALLCFVCSAIAGGLVAAQLSVLQEHSPLFSFQPSQGTLEFSYSHLENYKIGLVGTSGAGQMQMTIGGWRSVQHVGLWLGVAAAALGGAPFVFKRSDFRGAKR